MSLVGSEADEALALDLRPLCPRKQTLSPLAAFVCKVPSPDSCSAATAFVGGNLNAIPTGIVGWPGDVSYSALARDHALLPPILLGRLSVTTRR
jgi:hypothetical protein